MRAPKHVITVHKSNLDEVKEHLSGLFGKEWSAITNCDGKWSMFWDGFENPHYYRLHISDEAVALEVALRWG